MSKPIAKSSTAEISILFQNGFERGAEVRYSEPWDSVKFLRVPANTHNGDDSMRIVEIGGFAILQEKRTYWESITFLGDAKKVAIREDHPRGCYCEECQ